MDPTDLVPAPSSSSGNKKNYNFDKRRMDKDARQAWQAERDKRRMKAQKKDARRKELDSVAVSFGSTLFYGTFPLHSKFFRRQKRMIG